MQVSIPSVDVVDLAFLNEINIDAAFPYDNNNYFPRNPIFRELSVTTSLPLVPGPAEITQLLIQK